MDKLRRVMIATPCYDGKTDCNYNDSLLKTILKGVSLKIDIHPIYIIGDALIQRARNDLFKIAFEDGADDLIFIDSDICWNPDDFFKLLNYNVDIVGGTYKKKHDSEMYVMRTGTPVKRNKDGLIEVEGLGTGFIRISRKAIEKIWKYSEKYIENNEKKSNAFYVDVKDGDLISEDLVFCRDWIKHKGKVYLDPSITCNHIGTKNYIGNFLEYITSNKLLN